jgi:HEAT repeat protein
MQRLIVGLIACSLALTLAAGAHGQAGTFLGEPVSRWQADLSHKDPAVRRSAAFALGQLGSRAFVAVGALLRKLEKDPDPGVREMAATAIGDIVVSLRAEQKILDNEVVAALQKALDSDGEPRVQRSAAYALGTFRSAALPAVGSLKKALANGNASVRQNAAWALGQVGPDVGEDGVTALVEMLKDKDALVRRDAAGALGELGETAAEGAAGDLMKLVVSEPDDVVSKTTVEALTRLAKPKHKDAPSEGLERLLKHKDPELRLSAALVLARIGGRKAAAALPTLQNALKDEDTHIQSLSAAALAALGAEAAPAVEDLARALKDSTDRETRRNAALALGHIGKEARPAVPILAEALAASIPVEVRQQAAEALAQIGFPHIEAALPAVLQAIQNDADPLVRQRCVWALFQYKNLKGDDRATRLLAGVLEDKAQEFTLVRYDAARLLAFALGADAPERTADVLLEMLANRTLRVFNRTEATVQAGNEASAGRSAVEPNLGGDARFMAAEALGWLGKKLQARKDVLDALKAAAKDPDTKLQEAARRSLMALKAQGIE